MADRFYTPLPLGPGEAVLEGSEAHHLAHVRRLGAGDRVTLFNGDGKDYRAVILSVGKRAAHLSVEAVEESDTELGFRLQVASALPKGDRADYLIEKLTELGVTDFVPLQTARSVVHPRETRVDKFQRAVIEASKQCGRNVLMRVYPLTTWSDYCRRDDLPAGRFLAHPGGPGWVETLRSRSGDVAFAVGPEGGFTDEEVSLGRQAGWQLVSLGRRILRIETAASALAALASVLAKASGEPTTQQSENRS